MNNQQSDNPKELGSNLDNPRRLSILLVSYAGSMRARGRPAQFAVLDPSASVFATADLFCEGKGVSLGVIVVVNDRRAD